MTDPMQPVLRSGLPYPLVECANHEPAPGYAVCKHVVLDGRPVGSVELATPEELGVVMCVDDVPEHMHRDHFVLLCPHCVQARGWLAPS